ncbi:hypothetical protein GOB93_14395 [Acetobacter musti]|uniref:Lipoprotein n=2 Tax=Acetobacter musti TaxID=864732 RepID=A0ABX0JQT9_9PROT|nr:hypothetical protein [Acetobacter musti]
MGQMRGSVILAALTLSACTSLPHEARSLIGMSRPDLVACAGVPDVEENRDGQDVLVWKQDQQAQGAVDLKTPLSFELDLGGHGTCHTVAALRSGRVVSIAFTGPSGTIEGPNGACRPILRACLRSDSRP